ncbi:hypothetical protein RAS1_17570 [Phycisphaerae bacterium RAS1]|nr:hypothetical protein RAS1_17570 [Phycisphaerae bacterium RAS1]
MSGSGTLDTLAAEAAPAALDRAGVQPAAAAKLDMLDGDEIIQFSIKPSAWYIFLVSARWIGLTIALGAALAVIAQGRWSLTSSVAFQLLSLVAVGRVGVATLQWASRLYVLTNRRVLAFKGVQSVEVAQCLLTRVAAADLRVTGGQGLLRLGSIVIAADREPAARLTWQHISRPAEVHQMLLSAIRRSHAG